jgi:RNA polymerase sigma-70 factor (ECF subfamily)
MEQTTRLTVEDLLAHGRWVRAIARHLAREDAEDVVQDVWAVATEAPPRDASSPRGWLAKVLVNRVRTRARADERRGRRELASEAWAARPATPEEAAARMELQRVLATAIAALPEPYRHVVYLRYVEEREPSEIARLLGEPAGTIRWRLKEALSRLRAQLDQRFEGRREAWALVLLPAGEGLIPRRSLWPSPLVMAAAGATAILLVSGLWLLRPRGGSSGLVASGEAARSAGSGEPRATPPRFAVQAGEPEDDRACPAVAPMKERLALLRRIADPWRNIREVFEEGAPNPVLEAKARSLFDRLLEKAPAGCEHSVTCRGPVCEVAILIPDGVDRFSCHPKPDASLWDHLSSGMNNLVDSGTPFHDPIKRASYTKMSLLQRFARDDGAPVPVGQRPRPVLGYDFAQARPTMPATLPDRCRRSWRTLEAKLDELETWVQEVQPEQAFAASAANPTLAGRAERWARGVLGRASGRLPFEIECRARVCALSPAGEDDPLAIKWQCQEATGTLPRHCFPARNGGDWVQLLEGKARRFGRLRFPVRQGDRTRPAYLVVRDLGRDRRPGPWTAVIAFADSFPWREAIAACDRQFPGKGILKTKLVVPVTTGEEDPPKRVSLEVGGELAGTPLARCVSAAIEGASARFTIPAISNGATIYADFKFPFDPSSFEAKLSSLRKTVEEERIASPL